MQRVRIAIVGAGIGGLSLALGLARAGLRGDVYEQATELREVGAGVQLAPNATRLLHRLGLADRLRSVGVVPQAIEMRRWDDGRLLTRVPLGAACEAAYGAPYYTIHRAELHGALHEQLAPGSLHLGLRCVRVEQTGDEVVLHFADGSTRRADLVVGCDGIHSVVREALVRDEPRFSGQIMYRGLVPMDRVAFLRGEPRSQLWLGPHQHCVCYPVSRSRLVSFAATAPDSDWQTESWTATGRVEDLLATYAGWHPDVVRLLSAADEVSRWALHDRDPVDRWTHGRITLLGDAAHPMLPFKAQGANQAVEDAAALVACLTDAHAGDIVAALARYERVRMRRTADIQRLSRTNAETFHLSDGGDQLERDDSMATEYSLRGYEWLFGYDAARIGRQAA